MDAAHRGARRMDRVGQLRPLVGAGWPYQVLVAGGAGAVDFVVEAGGGEAEVLVEAVGGAV
jgi:hypothetical protein